MTSSRKANKDSVFVFPKTEIQADYMLAIESSPVTFGIGCAGTGKTFLALAVAARMLQQKEISQIVITRPNVSSNEKSLGFFKGTKEEKIAEWMRPAIKILRQFLGAQTFETMVSKGSILMEPLETMRGETFDNAFVLLDEAQNVTFDDLEMFLTRIGENSKVVIDGDIEQTDLKHTSGLHSVITMVRQNPFIKYPVIEFGIDDVVRSNVCKQFIQMFRQWRKENFLH